SGSCTLTTSAATAQTSSITATYAGDTHLYPSSTSAAATLYISPKVAVKGLPSSQQAGHCTGFNLELDNANGIATTAPSNLAVDVFDEFGNLVQNGQNARILLSFDTNPCGGTLTGTMPQTSDGGIVSFPDLSINTACTGYTLRATCVQSCGQMDNTSSLISN